MAIKLHKSTYPYCGIGCGLRVGKDILIDIVKGYLNLFETLTLVYEKHGNYEESWKYSSMCRPYNYWRKTDKNISCWLYRIHRKIN